MTRVSSALMVAALMLTPLARDAGAQRAGARGRAQGAAPAARAVQKSPGAGPVLVIETGKGSIEFETYPNEAPKTVDHILTLVKRNFYNGQRVHRVAPGFVVQFGDPQTRDVTKRELWGTGGSGRAIGVAEVSPKHTHKIGAVAIAHAGDPTKGDSQMYITMSPQPRLDKNFVVFGQVLSGMDVVRKLQVGDIIRRVTVKAGG